ncbi:MAG: dihydrolipoyl dehydrogenase [Deltaproteobacteria bacterium]|jgi:dihydrolipoamide dehydrogenase|nr:dihydrolipoyl dehydrogenase [Deltaproteobacteria bacterium]
MDFDVIVIGSGPGGYVAAIRCAQLGKKTAIIEKYPNLGGTCLNVGCIPSKALLASSEHFHNIQKNIAIHGITVDNVNLDFPKLMARKESVIDQNCKGIDFLMSKNKIQVFPGLATFINKNEVIVTGVNGEKQTISADNFIIATGSKPTSIPGVNIDKERIITSTEALSFKEIPDSMVIIGAGVIGLELGSVYARLGTKIQVVEFMDSLIPNMDKALSKELQRALKKLGMKFHLNHKVQSVSSDDTSVKLIAKNNKDAEVSFEADYCLVATGRKPYSEGLGLADLGIETEKNGMISVNDDFQTITPNVCAIGDVIRGPMLAHKASEEGVYVAEYLAGLKPHINTNAIPGVVYTHPEVSSVGASQEELTEKGIAFKSGSFTYRALGRARAANEINGFVKVLANEVSDKILGVHIIGANASDMIGEAVAAIEMAATAAQVGNMSHAHPTYSEAIKEACLAATADRCIHS